MIKDILNSNEEILPNTKQIEVLKENFPACFNADGSFDIERFKEYLSDKLMVSNEGYELKFLGKNYARLLASKPIVIIDEPHRFSRDQKAFKVILDEIKPQSIIRFGATFPETTTGRGKNKITIKDYQNLLYDLNACASFNQGLIKGVAKEHFEPVSKKEEKVKITSIDSKEAVHFQYKKKDEATRSFICWKG